MASDQIPTGTGLVQSVECNGICYNEDSHEFDSRLESPVVAQITTFANGIRRVCCPKAAHLSGAGRVHCTQILGGADCIYAWEDPKKKG